jgi:hypothetical protein
MISLDHFTKITNGQEDITIYGRVTYEDESKRTRCEPICVLYIPDRMQFPTLCSGHANLCDKKSQTIMQFTQTRPDGTIESFSTQN